MRTKLLGLLTLAGAFAVASIAYGAVTPIPPANYTAGCSPQQGVALQGDSANDIITGTNANDLLKGGGGNDTIKGLDGNDCLFGQGGTDKVVGANGLDIIKGGNQSDNLQGGGESDVVQGGGGPDKVNPGPDKDVALGGNASDTMKTDDGVKDEVNCGNGTNDVATVDKKDKVQNCETVHVKNK